MADLQDAGWWGRFWHFISGGSRLREGSTAYGSGGYTTPGGTAVTTDTALKLSAVWACVRLRSQTIASLPLHLRDSNSKIAAGHDLYGLLHDAPNADMCASEFWEAMLAALDLSGNAYAQIKRNGGGKIIALDLLDPERMNVARAKDGSIGYHYDIGGGTRRVFHENAVFHLRGFTLDGLVGLSPIRYAGEVMGGQIEANKAALHEFKNRLKSGGFLEYEKGILQPEQRTKLREILKQHSAAEHAGEFLILENGLKVSGTDLRLNPVDAQLLESRMFGIEEICRAFGVPPQLIGHTDKASSWASSLDATNMGFLTYSLRPSLVRIEQTISRKLLSPAERKQYRPKFAVEGMLRTDTAARAQFYAQMLQNGVMSRNDVRRLEDLPPVDGGDELTVQLNLTTINQIGQIGKV